jgi:hypothetical protein
MLLTMPNDVEEFLATLDHPRREEFRALRALLLELDPGITEGIKWKAPSFHYGDWFATFHLRSPDRAQMILHTGVKVKASAVEGVPVEDPEDLLTWLAKDRAIVSFANLAEIEAKREALSTLLRQWIRQMEL